MESWEYLEWFDSLDAEQLEMLATFPDREAELKKKWDRDSRLKKLVELNGGPGRCSAPNGFTPIEVEMQSIRMDIIGDFFRSERSKTHKRSFWELITDLK